MKINVQFKKCHDTYANNLLNTENFNERKGIYGRKVV